MLECRYSQYSLEVGCDEAGRGCLAGPVTAAAVVLPEDFSHPMLDDSKKLKAIQRYELREIVQERALYWAVAFVDNLEIDRINILNASFLAMHKAIDKLPITPEYIIVDGNRFKPYQDIPHQTIIKGDGKYLSIAAASILAKTYRDDFMIAASKEYPGYGWEKNMGYPTVQHRKAIGEQDITPLHRRSFRLIPEQMGLFP